MSKGASWRALLASEDMVGDRLTLAEKGNGGSGVGIGSKVSKDNEAELAVLGFVGPNGRGNEAEDVGRSKAEG